MAKKEKGAMFAQNNNLIEEHLKAAFKAASDASIAVREETDQCKKNFAAETEQQQALEASIDEEIADQKELLRLLKEHTNPQLRELHDENTRLRNERDALKVQKVTDSAEVKQAKDALENWRKTWEEEKALEELRICKLEEEVRLAEERWQSLSKKQSGKELDKRMSGVPLSPERRSSNEKDKRMSGVPVGLAGSEKRMSGEKKPSVLALHPKEA